VTALVPALMQPSASEQCQEGRKKGVTRLRGVYQRRAPHHLVRGRRKGRAGSDLLRLALQPAAYSDETLDDAGRGGENGGRATRGNLSPSSISALLALARGDMKSRQRWLASA